MEQVKQHTSHIYRAGHWFRLLCYVEEHRQKIYNWLASPDHDSKHRNASDIRQETTGSWVVKGEHLQEWRVLQIDPPINTDTTFKGVLQFGQQGQWSLMAAHNAILEHRVDQTLL
jgi:hypothetical protein